MSCIEDSDKVVKKVLEEQYLSFQFDTQQAWQDNITRFYETFIKKCQTEFLNRKSRWHTKRAYLVALHCCYMQDEHDFKKILKEVLHRQSGVGLIICFLLHAKSKKYFNVLNIENAQIVKRRELVSAIDLQWKDALRTESEPDLQFVADCFIHLGIKAKHTQLLNEVDCRLPPYIDHPSDDGAHRFVPALTWSLEANRLASMIIYPDSGKYPVLEDLAKNGYHYTRTGKDLQCYICKHIYPSSSLKESYKDNSHAENCEFYKSKALLHKIQKDLSRHVINADPEKFRKLFTPSMNDSFLQNGLKVCWALAEICDCIASFIDDEVYKIYYKVFEKCKTHTFLWEHFKGIQKDLRSKTKANQIIIERDINGKINGKLPAGLRYWIEEIQSLSIDKKKTPKISEILKYTNPVKWLTPSHEAAWEIMKPYMSTFFKIDGTNAFSFDIGQLLIIMERVRGLESRVSDSNNIWDMRKVRDAICHSQFRITENDLKRHCETCVFLLNDGENDSGLYCNIKRHESKPNQPKKIDSLIKDLIDLPKAKLFLSLHVTEQDAKSINIGDPPFSRNQIEQFFASVNADSKKRKAR